MKKYARILAFVMVLAMTAGSFSACGSDNSSSKASSASSGSSSASSESASVEKDTITALLPPVSANYQSKFEQYQTEFNALYPNLTLSIEPAGWEDMTQKLDTQVNAGNPPDIAFIGSSGISKYVELGMLMDIGQTATDEMILDFDQIPLDYMRNGSGLYGFPAYMSIQSIGGNKAFLEEAGIDWQSVQKNGWTYEEFREAIKKGVVKEGNDISRYGFVFACSGVASKDYLSILIKNAGMPAAFTEDGLKYAYTSKNYLEVLKAIRELIDDGSMPKELGSVDAGKRWNMFLTGQTMITGKGIATFENSAKTNNKKIEKKDGSAVEGSIPVDYVVLPAPTFVGQAQQSTAAIDGYVTFRGKNAPTEAHIENVVKAAYYMASGQVAAETNSDLFLSQLTKSGREAAKSISVDRAQYNMDAVDVLAAQAAPARPDIPTDLGAKAIKIEDEVIVPKLQALLADEITPEEMYNAIKEAAIAAFGENGIVKD